MGPLSPYTTTSEPRLQSLGAAGTEARTLRADALQQEKAPQRGAPACCKQRRLMHSNKDLAWPNGRTGWKQRPQRPAGAHLPALKLSSSCSCPS